MSRMGVTPRCVLCHVLSVDTRWRPFCSERCRNVDLAKWIDGAYRVAPDPLDLDADTNDLVNDVNDDLVKTW